MRPISHARREALHAAETTRRIEQAAADALPLHALMARAGLSVARLARALQPHARCIWVACGPGNNGGDGLVAATHLHRWARAHGDAPEVVVTHWTGAPGEERRLPPDARNALRQARAAGVRFATEPPASFDIAIDAVFGIGLARAPQGALVQWITRLRHTVQPVLCVDVPSGLDADTGAWSGWSDGSHDHGNATPAGPRHTLSLLTLKPGLFTAFGRDAAGQVWFDDLQVTPAVDEPATAWLAGRTGNGVARTRPPHASHKGSFGDVVVIGGQDMAVNGVGMTGAALLAARAALYAGAGRVFVGLLGAEPIHDAIHWDPACPELMFRRVASLLDGDVLRASAVVCGCGGGASVAAILPQVLTRAPRLILDADALNAMAGDKGLRILLHQRGARGWITVLTPHPLEAARLLGSHTAEVTADRLKAARTLSEHFGAVCVLKGSGSVISAPGQPPLINPTGNASLATAGTGDVLAGMIGGALAQPGCTADQTLERVAQAVFQHGWLADHWHQEGGSGERTLTLSANRLAARVRPFR